MVNSTNEYNLLAPLLFPIALILGLIIAPGINSSDASILIVLSPLVAFPIILISGQIYNGNDKWKNNLKEGGIIAVSALLIPLLVSIWIIGDNISHTDGHSIITWLSDWIEFQVLEENYVLDQGRALGIGVWIDSITLMLIFVASFLCFLICWFSMGYMNTDPINENRNHRFYAEFVLFAMGMFGMVLADNFLWLFIFWEIMGLCSYLLIGFYFWKESAAKAAKKAFLTTRVGDVFLMIGLFILYDIYDSLEFSVIFDDPSLQGTVDSTKLFWALLLMFVGAVGKSAQFPLHVWLPDAMEGPTPVSALIHAATMVNAGLYLVARMVPFVVTGDGYNGVEGLDDLGLIIAWIGGITAFMAASIAFVQNDIKKVLAYSTMSQLAYIFTGLGAAIWLYNNNHYYAGTIAFGASMFHLFNHAMAKGMLFMASGSVIHEVHHAHDHIHHENEDSDHHFDPQDMRNMGGLASKLPITATAMMIGSMSIIGIPLIGGFWSKEGIIAETWASFFYSEPIMLGPAILVLLTAGMTGFYMSRMWFMTFAGAPKSEVVNHVKENTPWIKEPLVILTLISAFSGILLSLFGVVDYLAGKSDHLSYKEIIYTLEHAFIPEDGKLMIIGWTTMFLSSIIGPIYASRVHGGPLNDDQKSNFLISWLVNLSGKFGKQDVSDLSKSSLANALQERLYIDDFYDWLISKTVIPFSHFSAWFDKNIIDGIIKQIESRSILSSLQIRKITTGKARDYILMTAVGMLSIFILAWGASR